MRKAIVLSAVTVLISSFVASQERQTPPPEAQEPLKPQPQSPVQVLPIVSLRRSAPMVVTIAFTNTSGRHLKLMRSNTEKSIFLLETPLYREDKIVARAVTDAPPVLSADKVFILLPEESVDIPLNIGTRYRTLKPGRYELRGRYKVEPTYDVAVRYGVTSLDFDKKLLYLDIE